MLVISAPLDLDLNIAAERAHEAEQSLKRETFKASAPQIGNVGLADPYSLGCSLLGKPGLLDALPDKDRQTSFDQVLVDIGQPEVGKNVVGAADNGCLSHGDLSPRSLHHIREKAQMRHYIGIVHKEAGSDYGSVREVN